MPRKHELATPEKRLTVRSLEDLVGYHLRRASVMDLQGSTAALADVNLRPVSMSVLCNVIEKPGATAAEICRVLDMQRSNIVSILADLEGQGLVLRETDETDQRIQRLYATKRGFDVTSNSFALLSAHEERLLVNLHPSERSELLRLLSLIWQR
ncbi:DNA-binding MarR family transcriptional regulator [Rhizobium sp. WW_1]|jgi:DNA-binding MarR family transcriptional regulator|nr:DNA-binding MarR family transcriptional regulator [Rhizobium sp. WW_1]